jgi:hypothetical protein
MKGDQKRNNIRTGAKVALVVLLLNVVGQLVAIYQTRQQLISPLIPEGTFWKISEQFVFQAIASASASVIALLLFFFEKYWFVIILVGMILIAGRLIYF